MIPVIMSQRIGKKNKYVLNDVKGSVFAVSMDKLNPKATSPCTLSFSDGSPDLITSFDNGTLNKTEVENYIGRNRVLNSAMNIDSNSDGLVDNWTYESNGYDGVVIKTIDDGQRFDINNGTNTNNPVLSQKVTGLVAGETINFSSETKSAGNIKVALSFIFLTSSDAIIGTYQNIGENSYSSYTTITSGDIIVPTTAAKIQIFVYFKANQSGSSGSAWFKNALVKKVPTFAINDSMSVDSNLDGVADGWTFSQTATGTKDVSGNGQHFNMTNSSAQYQSLLNTMRINNISPSESITCRWDYILNIIANSPKFVAHVTWYQSNDTVITTDILLQTTTSQPMFSTYYSTKTAPALTSYCILSMYIQASAGAGDKGEIYFKNVKVYRSNVSAFVKQWTDQSPDKYANLVNLLGTDGNFIKDTNADNLADGWTQNGTLINKSLQSNQQLFTPQVQYHGLSYNLGNSYANKKIYTCCELYSTSSNNCLVIGDFLTWTSASSLNVANSYTFISAIGSVLNNTNNINVQIRTQATTGFAEIKVKKVYAIDLTQIFGAGNEPSKATMDAYMQGKSYFTSSQYLLPQNHAIQNTAANQPRIMNNGIWDVDGNGKVSPYYNGINHCLICANFFGSGNISLSCSNVFSKRVLGTSKTISGVESIFKTSFDSPNNFSLLSSANGTSWQKNITSSVNLDTQTYINTCVANSSTTDFKSYSNGTNILSSPGYTGLGVNANSFYISGKSNGVEFFDGTISEVIYFNKALSDTERQKLEKNQGKRYRINVGG